VDPAQIATWTLHPSPYTLGALESKHLDFQDMPMGQRREEALHLDLPLSELKYGLTRGDPLIITTPDKYGTNYTEKEISIQKIQDKISGTAVHESTRKLLLEHPYFSSHLAEVSSWSKKDAQQFIKAAQLHIKTQTRLQVLENHGYMFGDELSYLGQPDTLIVMASNAIGNFCAKVGWPSQMATEFQIAQKVNGPCVMPVYKLLELSNGAKSALICPWYDQTVEDWVLSQPVFVDEIRVVIILLCGLSAICSFASHGYAHCDIKLNNLMFVNRSSKCVLIDFGSATKFDCLMTSSTPGISFQNKSYNVPSMRFDVNSLAILMARVMSKKLEECFVSKGHLLSFISPLIEKYPIAIQMLKEMRIDEDIESVDELLNVWKNLYALAKNAIPQIAEFKYWESL
jgi:hypothetical protein